MTSMDGVASHGQTRHTTDGDGPSNKSAYHEYNTKDGNKVTFLATSLQIGRRLALVLGLSLIGFGAMGGSSLGHIGKASACTVVQPLAFSGTASVSGNTSGYDFTGGTATVSGLDGSGTTIKFTANASSKKITVSQTGTLSPTCQNTYSTDGTVTGSLTLSNGASCTFDSTLTTFDPLSYFVGKGGADTLRFMVKCAGGTPPVIITLSDITIGATGATATPEAPSSVLFGGGVALVLLGLGLRRRRVQG